MSWTLRCETRNRCAVVVSPTSGTTIVYPACMPGCSYPTCCRLHDSVAIHRPWMQHDPHAGVMRSTDGPPAVQLLELDPGNAQARANVRMWEPVVAEQQEKMKEEMMGKLKDLGNSVLGHFGMSLDNFKMEKDPNSGGYSIKMQQ
jgi:hypothetical protein